MTFSKYIYSKNNLKMLIEEDFVGYYLIIYNDPQSLRSDEDYLLDSLEEAFDEAEQRFGVVKNQWIIVDN